MKKLTKKVSVKYINTGKSVTMYMLRLICFMVLLLSFNVAQAQTDWPGVTLSKDGTPISYEIYGAGEPTLIFVHGWSCDARYWRAQLSHFSRSHRVITLDLAGHGHSGTTRSKYTMLSFGEDVRAVADATDSKNIILIGHSMGGSVIAEASRLMPKRVIGLIGIDALDNIEYPLTRKNFELMIEPFKKDFRSGTQGFVKEMMLPGTDPLISDWILSDMSSAPSAIALSAMSETLSQFITGELAKIFDEIRIPVVTVNGDMWPINYEANRRHMFSFDAIVLKKADHFLMLNRSEEFNKALENAIKMILQKKVK